VWDVPIRSTAEAYLIPEMCSGAEAVSYLRRIDFVYHSTLAVRVIKKKYHSTLALRVINKKTLSEFESHKTLKLIP